MKQVNQVSSASIRTRLGALIVALLVVLAVVASQAKDPQANGGGQANNNQPLAGLDKILRQANGVKVDAIVDQKLATNVTNTLNDMALNLRRMLVENKRLTMQVQDLVSRVQNVTGVNATNTLGNLQQQSTNISGLASSINLNQLSTLMPRFNV